MEKLKDLVKQLPLLRTLIHERDKALSENSRLLREVAALTATRDRLIENDQDYFLKESKGVIHIGANLGQERELYSKNNLDVLWIEPIPDIFLQLLQNLRDFPSQRALKYLLTDVDNRDYEFHVASNSGASSSIFNLAKHQEIWPEIRYVDSVHLRSTTFATLVQKENVPLDRYDSLVIDTQGSELLVFKGAGDLVRNFRFIKTEAADFEVYEECCTLSDLENYLAPYGFTEVSKKRFAARNGVGNCYDIIFEKTGNQLRSG